MKLSIIVPVYNMAGGNKLKYCLDSLLQQTLEDYEIIPVDDKSTDDSASILREYAAKYPEVVHPVFSPENRRQGGAKNLGIDAAAGEWIGIVDADDWVSPDMYEKLLRRAEETGADVVGTQYSITSEQSMEIGRVVEIHSPHQEGEMTPEQKRLFVLQPGSMVVKIYKREVIEKNHLRYPEHTFYEDNLAGPVWMMYFHRFALVNEPLYYYYQHDASTVHTVNMDRLHNRMDMATGMVEEFQKMGLADFYHKELESNFIRTYYANTLFSYMQETRRVSFGFLKQLREGVKKYYPNFMESESFQARYDAEQQKMMALHMKSILFYVVYDRSLRLYRKLRYRQ